MSNHADYKAPLSPRSFVAGQDFITACKVYWHKGLFPAVRDDYERRAGLSSKPAEAVDDIAALMKDSLVYQYFSWFERHLQRYKYSGRYGLVEWYKQNRDTYNPKLAEAPEWLLELHPDLEMPKYYANWDIHQHPGGVWSDEMGGLVYERAASTTTPLAGGKHSDMHDKFVDIIASYAKAPTAILDMACGFGKTTRPLYERFQGAKVTGVDLSAPCLKVAALRAKEAGATNVKFVQADAADTGFADASFDVVASSMMLHEMPPPHIEKTLAETARVLKPGGEMIHLDFYHFPSPFHRFIHYTHGRRNNEPFMEPLAEMDLPKLLTDLGFADITIEPFAEAEGVLSPEFRTWRFPWTVIRAKRAA